jgi:hypothetical protein
MKKNILFISLLFTFASCDYPLVESRENGIPKVAVSSFFTPDSLFRVRVEPVTDAFTTLSNSLKVEKVKVTNMKTDEVFQLEAENDFSPIYTSPKVIPKPGDIFKVEAFTDGNDKPVTAIDTIPDEKPYFRLVKTGVTSCTPWGIYYEINIKPMAIFKFMPNKKKQTSYYEFFVLVTKYGNKFSHWKPTTEQVNLETTSAMITAEDYYPSNPVVDEVGPLSLLFKCSDIQDSVAIDFSYQTAIGGNQDSLFTLHIDLTIELREVSCSYFKYMTSLYNQQYAIDGNYIYGTPGPIKVFSNVENGTGTFAGYTSTILTTHLEPVGYPRN